MAWLNLEKKWGKKIHGAIIEMMSMWEADLESKYCCKHSKDMEGRTGKRKKKR